MISLETFHELYNFNWWARDRQLEACAALTPEQFLTPVGGSFPSIRDTLAHLVAAEWLYLERWQGRSPTSMPAASEFPTLDSIRERWRGIEVLLRSVLAGLDDRQLARPVTYTNIRKQTKTLLRWQMMYHLLNHQSYHRGQVTTQLRLLGAAPPAVDFYVYLDSRK